MESTAQAPDVSRIERLMAEMAMTFNWVSLYQAGHPSLAGRVEKLHRNLANVVTGEPSGHLLLGVAKDKILYQNVFLGNGSSLVRSFTSELFLQHVATLDFSSEVTSQELLVFFLSLQRLRVEKGGGSSTGFWRERVCGGSGSTRTTTRRFSREGSSSRARRHPPPAGRTSSGG